MTIDFLDIFAIASNPLSLSYSVVQDFTGSWGDLRRCSVYAWGRETKIAIVKKVEIWQCQIDERKHAHAPWRIKSQLAHSL